MRLTEQDVLEYFRNKKFFRDKFKVILDAHLKHIKAHRGDIVESWRYYTEFEKMYKHN